MQPINQLLNYLIWYYNTHYLLFFINLWFCIEYSFYCGQIHVKSKKCLTHLCDTIVCNKTREGFCFRCYIYNFPDRTISRNYKTKERCVVDNLKKVFPNFDWISETWFIVRPLDVLIKQIHFCVDNPTETKIDTIELFY